MSIINIQNIEQYPENYNWLTEEEKNIILNYMNGMQALANQYYKKYMDNIEEYVNTKNYITQYNHTITSLTGSKNAYATLGIMVEYNWPDHKNMWALATKSMAENYITYEEEENNDEENLNELLDYEDVGH